jgi:hypothetical protein
MVATSVAGDDLLTRCLALIDSAGTWAEEGDEYEYSIARSFFGENKYAGVTAAG